MDKSNAIKILNSRKRVIKPATLELRVTSTVAHVREDGTAVTIVNLQAMTDYQEQQARKALREGDYQQATNFALSTNVRPDDYTPAKGEYIKVRIDYYTNKDGIQALGVAAISPIVAERAANVNFSDFEDELESDSDDADLTTDEATEETADEVVAEEDELVEEGADEAAIV